ncbi:hypothetical protein [Siphonobacter sp. SORGH_AS_1065]|uniref:hypothetical protein n=1 Tax=Siphonobacter sp. SORGH_AS_1065 TaxID=3041795 RepID=UPI00277D58A1|nr:hypothetical protein [Siphonobacter sp. SORGH_AS_1065]MDQ1086456.1 CxxC motif-containing protein [Siphonobacter sp. SORGH_AS_1065]
MKQPKENHPIDELFARKLKNHEQAPQSQSWEKIQSRLNSSYTQRRGLPLWAKYSAAASIALLMMAGWWFQKASQPNSQELAVQQPKAITALKVVTPEPAFTPETEVAIATEEGRTAQEKPQVQESKVKVVPNKNTRPVPSQDKMTLEAVPVVESVARNEAEVKAPTPVTIEIPKATEVAVSKPEKPEEDKTFIVKVVESEIAAVDVKDEKPARKKKFFSRIAKSLKHIQEGEWKEVGLDGKAILARTEDNIFKKH